MSASAITHPAAALAARTPRARLAPFLHRVVAHRDGRAFPLQQLAERRMAALTTTTMGPRASRKTCALALPWEYRRLADKAVCLRRNGAICLRQAGYRRFRIGLAGLDLRSCRSCIRAGRAPRHPLPECSHELSWLSGGSVRPGPDSSPRRPACRDRHARTSPVSSCRRCDCGSLITRHNSRGLRPMNTILCWAAGGASGRPGRHMRPIGRGRIRVPMAGRALHAHIASARGAALHALGVSDTAIEL